MVEAILGTMGPPNCKYFHCLRLLKRLKDPDKCRIILNLSCPKGNSVNGNVDKQHFDENKFHLKFSIIDYIARETFEVLNMLSGTSRWAQLSLYNLA